MAIDGVLSAEVSTEPFPHLQVMPALPDDQFENARLNLPAPNSFASKGRGLKLELDVVEGNVFFDSLPDSQRLPLLQLRETVRSSAQLLAERFAGPLRAKYEWLLGEDIAEDATSKGWTTTNGRVMGRSAGYELPPHLDSAHFGVTCLLYFSSAESSEDGALGLYRPERRPEVLDASTYYPGKAEGISTSLVKTIPVHPHLFVAFVCGPESLHGFGRGPNATGWRFVYQAHVIPRGFRIEDLADRLPDTYRNRWLRVLSKVSR